MDKPHSLAQVAETGLLQFKGLIPFKKEEKYIRG
jgi:hypothetical protein